VAWLAFRVGSDWEALQRTITQYGTVAAIIAVVIVLIAGLVWFVKRRK